MASLGALKRSMALTLILIFEVLLVLIFALIFIITEYTGGDAIDIEILMLLILAIPLMFALLQWAISPSIIRWSSHLRYLKPGENPFLESTVRELCQKSGVPMPQLAVSPDRSPNAFVFGRSKSSATLAVHQGLLEQLNKGEIRAVLAHEVGHLKHNDMAVMTIVSVVPILAYMVARAVLFSGGRRDKNAGPIIVAGIIGFAVYIISQLLILNLSRQREFYADAFSAVSTSDPHSLSSALAKITYGLSISRETHSGAARSFYIGDPETSKMEIASIMQNKNKYDLDGDGVLDERELMLAMEEDAKRNRRTQTFSTHPSTFRRIQLLKEMEKDLKHGGMGGDIYKRI